MIIINESTANFNNAHKANIQNNEMIFFCITELCIVYSDPGFY